MAVGRYYQQNQQYIGAINRYRVVIERYQTTTHVPEALHRLSRATCHSASRARPRRRRRCWLQFPSSDWYQDSYY